MQENKTDHGKSQFQEVDFDLKRVTGEIVFEPSVRRLSVLGAMTAFVDSTVSKLISILHHIKLTAPSSLESVISW